MVKIRLRRVGAKRQASYRIVVADSRSPRSGRFIEVIGFYNPRTEPETVKIQENRALHWLDVGAQPTDAVARLLKGCGTLERLERLRQGEPLEVLVAEAEAAAQKTVVVSAKTRREPAGPAAKKPVEEPASEETEVEVEVEAEAPGVVEEETQAEAAEPGEAEEKTD